MRLLERFRWYRRRKGGHWERWIVDLGGEQPERWFRVWRCSLDPAERSRPLMACRGTPTCEDYS